MTSEPSANPNATDQAIQALNLRKMQAEIEKLTEETKKVGIDAALAPRALKLQHRTAFYSTLVPLASVLTVLGTVYTSKDSGATFTQVTMPPRLHLYLV